MTETREELRRAYYLQPELIPGQQRFADRIIEALELTDLREQVSDRVLGVTARAVYSLHESRLMEDHQEMFQKAASAQGKVRCLAQMLRAVHAGTLDELLSDPMIGNWMTNLYNAALAAPDGDDLDRPNLPTWT